MKTIKVSEATGAALDWLVAKCESVEVEYINDGITRCLLRLTPFTGRYSPSTDWSQGGPIIEREKIGVQPIYTGYVLSHWSAVQEVGEGRRTGPTPLIAAMRCFVVGRLGETVEVPEGLIDNQCQ